MTSQKQIQLGKKGLTKEFLEGLKKRFEKPTVKNIKISVLPSVRKSKDDVKKYSEEIKTVLGSKFTTRILGFSIFIKKWRKARE